MVSKFQILADKEANIAPKDFFIGVPLQTSILCILGELAEGRFLTLVVGLRGDLLDTIL